MTMVKMMMMMRMLLMIMTMWGRWRGELYKVSCHNSRCHATDKNILTKSNVGYITKIFVSKSIILHFCWKKMHLLRVICTSMCLFLCLCIVMKKRHAFCRNKKKEPKGGKIDFILTNTHNGRLSCKCTVNSPYIMPHICLPS